MLKIFSTILISGIQESSPYFLLMGSLAIVLAIVPIIFLLTRKDPLVLLLFPVLIYIFGPITAALVFAQTPLAKSVFPETAVEQTWLITYSVWLTVIAGRWLGLSQKLTDCLSSPTWKDIYELRIFKLAFLFFAFFSITLDLMLFRKYGASVLSGKYTGFSKEFVGAYVDPIRTMGGGAYYSVIFCSFIVFLSDDKRPFSMIAKILFAACSMLELLSGDRREFMQMMVCVGFLYYWRGQVKLASLGIGGIVLLGLAFLISVLRLGGNLSGGGLSLMSIFVPIGAESSLNSLSYNIAYSVANIDHFSLLALIQFVWECLLFTFPGFIIRALGGTRSTFGTDSILVPYMRFISDFSPVGGWSVFATVGYMFKSFFWPITILIPTLVAVFRFLPKNEFGQAVLLSAMLTALPFWRDGFTDWFKLFVQNIVVVILIVFLAELLKAITEQKPAGLSAVSGARQE
jgi:hypothetical protein